MGEVVHTEQITRSASRCMSTHTMPGLMAVMTACVASSTAVYTKACFSENTPGGHDHTMSACTIPLAGKVHVMSEP